MDAKTRCSTTSEQDAQPSVDGLIARLQAAADGSPEFDLEIAMMLHGDWLHANCEWTDEGWVHRQYGKVDIEARQFTRSIDDALSLVPEGWRVSQLGDADTTWEVELKRSFESAMRWLYGYGKTPAIALTVAALRARQAAPQTVSSTQSEGQNTDSSPNTTVSPDAEPGR